MINKKTSIILGIILVVLVLGGLSFYQYSVSNTNKDNLNNDDNSANVEQINPNSNQNENQDQIQVQSDGIKVEGSDNSGNTGPQGGLIVCVDKCGDGICQNSNTACDPKGLNCVCQESLAECPQDCKQ